MSHNYVKSTLATVLAGVMFGAALAGCQEIEQPDEVMPAVDSSGDLIASPPDAVRAPKPSAYTEGVYPVGTDQGDIPPGTYKTAGPTEIGICYWERLKDTSGEFDSIIANDAIQGPGLVTIAVTDNAFSTRGCKPWTKV